MSIFAAHPALMWTFIIIDCLLMAAALAYSIAYILLKNVPRNMEIPEEELREMLPRVTHDEMLCLKYGPREMVEITIASLINRGLVKTRFGDHDGERLKCGASKKVFEYYAFYESLPPDLNDLEQAVLNSLDQFKSSASVTAGLGDFPLFQNYRQKMADLRLLYQKGPEIGIIESFFQHNIIAVAFFAVFLYYTRDQRFVAHGFLLFAADLISSFVSHLCFRRGSSSFDAICPDMLPTAAYRPFITLYENEIRPLEGSEELTHILRRKTPGL